MMLYMCKKLHAADQALREGQFNLTGTLVSQVGKLGFLTTEMAGKTIGLIGYGRIAGELARMCRNGFDMNIFAYDPYVQKDLLIKDRVTPCKSMDEVFSQSDFVSIHVPLTQKTKGLIGLSQFSLMKNTAFFINTSRGGIVREKDLYQVLKSGRIAGAAVDVFKQEPPPENHVFFRLHNVLVTPHMAAQSHEALKRVARDVAAGVLDVLQGRRPKYIVNPEVL
jgi:D-3-phosphoglycerate dehydrogenase